jgi:hypothetical protein
MFLHLKVTDEVSWGVPVVSLWNVLKRWWCWVVPRSKVGGLAQGVKPGVTLAEGAACEAALAFFLNLAILYSMGE